MAGGSGTQSGGSGGWSGAAGGNSTWGGASNSTAGRGGSSGGRPAYLREMFARREKANEHTLEYMAAGLCGLLAIFIFFHWTRVLVNRHMRRTKGAPLFIPGSLTPFASFSRSIRNRLVRRVPGFTSGGHLLLTVAYVAINLACAFTNIETPTQSNFASRFGYILAANLFLTVFLSLKNTPFAYLTPYSYERINALHQIAGYTTFVWLILHASLYASYFIQTDKIRIMREHEQTAAIIAGFSMLLTVFAATVIRRFWYEVFLVTHILCYITILIAVGFHRPHLGEAIVVILILAAAIWALDRLVRYLRLAINSVNNSATLYPLSNGGTRVVLRKAPRRAAPGKHSFLWMPKIRAFEMHPFSIVSTDQGNCEFIVCAHDGFTRALHKHATEHPGQSLRASVDGAYGTLPDPMDFDKIILIAGGSGASFTFGLAVNILNRMTETSTQSIVFVWAVKEHENLSWFADHLETLRTHPNAPKCNVSLHVTQGTSRTAGPMADGRKPVMSEQRRARAQTGGSMSSGYDAQTPIDNEKESQVPDLPDAKLRADNPHTNNPTIPRLPSLPAMQTTRLNTSSSADPEKHAVEHAERVAGDEDGGAASPASSTASTASNHSLAAFATPGRPDTAQVIRREVAATPREKRVLVAACGPKGLMRVVRNTTADCIKGDGPAVELHCEQFGW